MKKLMILFAALASLATVPAFAARPHAVTVTRRVVMVPVHRMRRVVVKRRVARRPARRVMRVVRPIHPIHPRHPVTERRTVRRVIRR